MALKCKTRGPFMEIMVASTMLAVVWGLLSLPTVLYFLPPQIQVHAQLIGIIKGDACTMYVAYIDI